MKSKMPPTVEYPSKLQKRTFADFVGDKVYRLVFGVVIVPIALVLIFKD